MKYLVSLAFMLWMTPLASALDVDVTYSEDFKAKLSEDYGEREGKRLTEQLQKRITAAFEDEAVQPSRVAVVIEDAKPNKPTFKQLSDRPSLDFGRSISIGGASFSSVVFDATGQPIAEVDYKWFENDIEQAFGRATWSDAHRAMRQFSHRLRKEVNGASS